MYRALKPLRKALSTELKATMPPLAPGSNRSNCPRPTWTV
jgi:hypothetical protein